MDSIISIQFNSLILVFMFDFLEKTNVFPLSATLATDAQESMHTDAHRFPFHAERFHPPTERAETDSLATEVIDRDKGRWKKETVREALFYSFV